MKRLAARLAAGLAGIMLCLIGAESADARDRTLTFKQIHTGETLTVTYMRNGRHDPEALRKINYIMRDWRRNEVAEIDPHLIDILWEVRRATGSSAPVQVLSAYRSPVTNTALRQRSSGVAQNSQHTVGRALDFRLPDVPVQKLREIAMKFQAGGVGFYPSSGFVHIDTGRVRSWPRLSRQQLANLFPDGKTLHLPSDGKPLPGYEQAQAEAQRGRLSRVARAGASGTRIQTASRDSGDPSRPVVAGASSNPNAGRGLLAGLFGGPRQQQPASPPPSQPAEVSASPIQTPAPRIEPAPQPATATVAEAPVPAPRPDETDSAPATATLAAAPVPRQRPGVTTASFQIAALPPERPEGLAPVTTAGIASGAIEAWTALAPSHDYMDDLPFADTFTGVGTPRRTESGLIAINVSDRAIRPYVASESCLRAPALASLYHPDQSDLSPLFKADRAGIDNRFAVRDISFEIAGFSGSASKTDPLPPGEDEESEPRGLARLWAFFSRS